MNRSGILPVEFFVVIELDPVPEKVGSIIMPAAVSERDKLATQEGTLVAISPHAFDYAREWPEGTKPQLGQRVLFKKYAGALHQRRGVDYRLLNDKDIIAILQPEEDMAHDAAIAA